MRTLGGFPYPPTMVRAQQSWAAPHASTHDHELDAAVLGPARARDVGRDRVALAVALGHQPPGRDAAFDQRVLHALGAPLTELQVEEFVAAAVGVSLDLDLPQLGMLFQRARHLVD